MLSKLKPGENKKIEVTSFVTAKRNKIRIKEERRLYFNVTAKSIKYSQKIDKNILLSLLNKKIRGVM